MSSTKRTLIVIVGLIFHAGVRAQQPAANGNINQQGAPGARNAQTIPKKLGVNVPFEEKLLGTVPREYEDPPVVRGGPIFLDNPAQWAFVARQNGKAFVVVNNKKGPEFDQIKLLFHSRDLSTIGYIAQESNARDEKVFLVVGTKILSLQQGEAVDLGKTENAFSPPLFSADNKKLAYISFQKAKNKEAVAVVEGDWNDPAPVTVKFGPEFDWVWEPIFGPDGNILAYPAGDGTKTGKRRMFLVVGDKKAPNPPGLWLWATDGFDWVGYPAFSPDGSVIAYVARLMGYSDPAYIAVIGDKKSSRHNRVGRPIFSPDGATVAYSVLQSAEFLPDKRPKHGFVVTGNEQGPKFDGVGEPVFSPDGSSMAYPAKQNEKLFIVFGDKKGPEFDKVGRPVFSPDGHTIAFQAEQSQKQFIILGDKRGPEFGEVGEPVFSPDGAKVAYRARRDKKWLIVAGEKLGPEFDDVFHPYFSSDGSKVAYGARQGREFWWKVMDVR